MVNTVVRELQQYDNLIDIDKCNLLFKLQVYNLHCMLERPRPILEGKWNVCELVQTVIGGKGGLITILVSNFGLTNSRC